MKKTNVNINFRFTDKTYAKTIEGREVGDALRVMYEIYKNNTITKPFSDWAVENINIMIWTNGNLLLFAYKAKCRLEAAFPGIYVEIA